MLDFRNKYAVHRELDFNGAVPHFDTALAVAFYYDGWARTVISPDTISEPTLESCARSLQKSTIPLAEKLVKVIGVTTEVANEGMR